MLLHRRILDTPVGPMMALASDTALVALEFSTGDRHERLDARLARWLPGYTVQDAPNRLLDGASAWLDDYFAGRSADSSAMPIVMHGTDFERDCRRPPPA
jgi:O6-methylguanine-DNA--protein-cysteine methyltransferase